MAEINVGFLCVGLSLLNCIVGIATAVWVYRDATTLGIKKGQAPGFFNMSAAMWATASYLLWSVTLPLYLARRAQFKRIGNL